MTTPRFTVTIVGSLSAPEWKSRTPRDSVILPEDLPSMAATFPRYFDEVIVKVGDVSLPRGGREMIEILKKEQLPGGEPLRWGF